MGCEQHILSKHQCLLRLAQPGNCSWDDILEAWNALSKFIKPELSKRPPELRYSTNYSHGTLRKWRKKPGFPTKKVSALKLSIPQLNNMIRSVGCHIRDKEFEQEQFEAIILPKKREKDVDVSGDDLRIIPTSQPDREPAQHGTEPTSLPKQQCLSRLVQSQDRKWDDLQNAWDAMHEFIDPRLERRVSKLPSDDRLEKWRNRPYYPFEQMLALNFSKDEVNLMMRSVCNHITNMELGLVQGPSEAATPPKKRARDVDVPDDNVEIVPAPEPVPKRAKVDPKRASLPRTTKIYFMEENNQDSRTGIMVTLLSNEKPENSHLDINKLRYGNATHHLAKRSNFEKHRHQMFYYDLENPRVRINVDTVASFRAAVEEMFTYRKSEPRIEFCFREKDALTSNNSIAPVTPISNSSFHPPSGPRSWNPDVNRRIDFRSGNEQYAY